jgi:hypothetical protein
MAADESQRKKVGLRRVEADEAHDLQPHRSDKEKSYAYTSTA